MGKCRFVKPEVVRLALSESDWVDVKKRLTVGEERAAFQQIVGEVNSAGWRRPNIEMAGIAQIAAYIVQWSLVDERGMPVAVSVDAIKSLDSASFTEIETVVEAHIKAMEAEETKNVAATGGGNRSEPTLQPVA